MLCCVCFSSRRKPSPVKPLQGREAFVPHLVKLLRNYILNQDLKLPSGKVINMDVFQKVLDVDGLKLKRC